MATSQTAKEFKLSLGDAFEEVVEGQLQLIVSKLALEALSRVVMRSPVDLGRFRGNWNVSFGAMDTTTTTELDPTGQKTIAKGTGTISGYKGDNIIWLANSLPYANRLENGWSKQAPKGMVALTFAELSLVTRI